MKHEKQVKLALDFLYSEKELYGNEFNLDDCIEDIHRIYGLEIAEFVEDEYSDIEQAIERKL